MQLKAFLEGSLQRNACIKKKKPQINNTVLNNQEITEEIKEEIKKYLETNDNENTTIQNLWMQQKQF